MEKNRKQFIQKMIDKRMTYTAIAKLLGLSRQRVHQIHTGYRSPVQKPKPAINIRLALNPHEYNVDTMGLVKKPTKARLNIATDIKEGSRDRIRECIRIRDKHTCQICLKKWKPPARRFDVHHLDENHEGKSFESGSITYDRNNTHRMITLCHKCHLNLDQVRGRMKKASKIRAKLDKNRSRLSSSVIPK